MEEGTAEEQRTKEFSKEMEGRRGMGKRARCEEARRNKGAPVVIPASDSLRSAERGEADRTVRMELAID